MAVYLTYMTKVLSQDVRYAVIDKRYEAELNLYKWRQLDLSEDTIQYPISAHSYLNDNNNSP